MLYKTKFLNLPSSLLLFKFSYKNSGMKCRDMPTKASGPNACEIVLHSRPWMVNLNNCGGVLLSSKIVLSAQHCFYTREECTNYPTRFYGNRTAIFGEHDTTIKEDGEKHIGVEKIICHEDYITGS